MAKIERALNTLINPHQLRILDERRRERIVVREELTGRGVLSGTIGQSRVVDLEKKKLYELKDSIIQATQGFLESLPSEYSRAWRLAGRMAEDAISAIERKAKDEFEKEYPKEAGSGSNPYLEKLNEYVSTVKQEMEGFFHSGEISASFRSGQVGPSQKQQSFVVFISAICEEKDHPVLKRIESEFTARARGLKAEVYVAENRPDYGRDFIEKIQKKIRDSSVTLALLTDKGMISPWVNQEVGYALAQEGMRVVGLFPASLKELPAMLKVTEGCPYESPSQVERLIVSLIEMARAHPSNKIVI